MSVIKKTMGSENSEVSENSENSESFELSDN